MPPPPRATRHGSRRPGIGAVAALFLLAVACTSTTTLPPRHSPKPTGSPIPAPPLTSPSPGLKGKPNIVLILSDDQTVSEMSHMPTVGSELAGKGVTFRNAFVVNPLCCPSRTTILTGKYSHGT